ncbi:NADP-dependent oxidoreductase domain-containing protein [Hypoxylon sp. FL0890]|nr:NADP-dependent oxidoreductase domain-containing protein [Hypoxylon sp. FL0890]
MGSIDSSFYPSSHSNGPTISYSSGPNSSSYGSGPTNSYGSGPASSYSSGPNNSYGSGPTSSYASGPASSYGSGQKQTLSNTALSNPTLRLNDGNEIPMLAFGPGSVFSGQPDQVFNSALSAIRNGFYHLDVAEVDGNEQQLGSAIRQSGVPRSQLFITTKVWTVGTTVRAAFDASLERLGLDYVDLYLVNWPQIADKPDRLQQIWAEVEAIKESGRARSIGVSNFLPEHLDTILRTARVKPAINQIEYHTYLQHDNLINFHRQHGIATAAYAPLTPITKARPGPIDNIFLSLAKKYGVSEADIALRWVIDQGIVAVTSTSSEERLQSLRRNLPSFKLTQGEVQEISYLGKQKHFRGFFNDIFDAGDRR